METSSVTRQILTRADFRKWPWWSLPTAPRCYVGLVVVTAMGSACYAVSQTTWHSADLVKYSLLLGCSIVAIAGHPGKAILLKAQPEISLARGCFQWRYCCLLSTR